MKAMSHRLFLSVPMVGGALIVLLGLGACGSTTPPTGTGGTASGGQVGAGGAASGGQVGAGGGATTGGQSASSGGDSASVGGSSVGGSSTGQLPLDSSQASIEAFLTAETYKTWTHDAAPRTPIGTTNPHLAGDPGAKLQVYFNSAAAASIAENTGKPLLEVNHTVGSMMVKEVYDASGQRVGQLTSIKTGADRRAFTFYCEGPVDACGVGEAPPIYGTTSSPCSGCHGGSIFAPVPTP